MSFKRITLCVMYAMMTMFVINTSTADAEDNVIVDDTTEKVEYTNDFYMAASPAEEMVAAYADGLNNTTDNVQIEPAAVVAGEAVAAHEEAVAVPEVTQASEIVNNTDNNDNVADNDDDKKNDKNKSPKKSVKKTNTAKYTKADLRLLSALIYCEAGNEPYAGKLAVGIVVMNRKESRSFANSVRGVIYQKFQFSPVRNGSLKRALARYDSGRFNSAAHKQCIKAAKEALSGKKFVTHNGKDRNFKKYKYFNGYVKGAKYRIKGHMFK